MKPFNRLGILTLAVATLLFAVVIQAVCMNPVEAKSQPQDFSSATSRYSTQNKILKGVKAKQANAIFMGNSITEMWSQTHADFMPSNNYLNRGIGGQTTPQMLLRFREDVINLNPKVVVIEGGINDIAENTGKYDPDFTLGNIKSMAEIARANGIKVIITSVLPATQIPWKDGITGVRQKVADLNKSIKAYAKDNNFEYIDYYSALEGVDGNLKPEYNIDGVHIKGEGYSVLEPLIKAKINGLLNQK